MNCSNGADGYLKVPILKVLCDIFKVPFSGAGNFIHFGTKMEIDVNFQKSELVYIKFAKFLRKFEN